MANKKCNLAAIICNKNEMAQYNKFNDGPRIGALFAKQEV